MFFLFLEKFTHRGNFSSGLGSRLEAGDPDSGLGIQTQDRGSRLGAGDLDWGSRPRLRPPLGGLDSGPWTLDSGPWTLDSWPGTLNSGPGIFNSGPGIQTWGLGSRLGQGSKFGAWDPDSGPGI